MWLVLVLVVVVLAALVRRRRGTQLRSELPCWPLLGHLPMFRGGDQGIMKALQLVGDEALRQGGVSKLALGHILFAVVADPLDADFVAKNCLAKPELLNSFSQLIGDGSIFAPVPIWRPRRKVVAAIFSIKSLKGFVRTFSRQASIMADQLREVPERTDFSVWEYFTAYTMDSICETTLNAQVNCLKKCNMKILEAFEYITETGGMKVLSPWYFYDTIYRLTPRYRKAEKHCQYVANFISKIIESKRKEYDNKRKLCTEEKYEPVSFLEHLFSAAEEGRGFTDTELLEETIVLLLAATDTSAILGSFTLLMLSMHPRVLDKINEELDHVFGDSDRPVEAEDLHKLTYLEVVIKETLRLYPGGPVIARDVDKDIQLPSGLTLRSDCAVILHIYAIQRNPLYWGRDAEQFRPERFLEGFPTHPAAFVAFSYGPRGCIGNLYTMMSMKTALSTLLRQYRVLPAEGADSSRPLRLKYNIMMRHVDNYPVQIERKRNK